MKLDEITFQGYKRKNGKPGIRNRVLVVYTVKCAEFVARQIVDRSDDPDVELVGFDGCTDNQYAVNLLISLIRHPNVGAVLSVGLGCEYIQPEWLADIATKEGKLSQWMFIQKEGGTRSAMEKGLAFVQWALKKLKDNGIKTILAHPERYTAIQQDWDLAKRICDLGVLLQVNAYDLFLNKNDETPNLAHWMAKEEMISFIGSDMHGRKRPPKVKEGINWLYENVDYEYANAIVRVNAEKYLGVGAKVNNCNANQVEAISLILNDLKQL